MGGHSFLRGDIRPGQLDSLALGGVTITLKFTPPPLFLILMPWPIPAGKLLSCDLLSHLFHI
jgi:hypothetical protein